MAQATNSLIEDLLNVQEEYSTSDYVDDSEGYILSGKLTRKDPNDAGQDVHSSECVIIPAGGSAIISTDLIIAVPMNEVGILKSRSGLSCKHNLEVGAGVIDSGYRGEVKVHLYNHGFTDYSVEQDDKIAQLITIPINPKPYKQATQIQKSTLQHTKRGIKGFGASGR